MFYDYPYYSTPYRWRMKDYVTCSGCRVLLCPMYAWCWLKRKGLKWPRDYVNKIGKLISWVSTRIFVMRRTREMIGIRNWRKQL